MPIRYLNESEATLYKAKLHVPRTGYYEDGYCKKGSTQYFVKFLGSNRKHKVWCTCFSNCASHWITANRMTYHVPDWMTIMEEL